MEIVRAKPLHRFVKYQAYAADFPRIPPADEAADGHLLDPTTLVLVPARDLLYCKRSRTQTNRGRGSSIPQAANVSA